MAGVRRADGFLRYALSVQYHGSSFLGFSYQKSQENTWIDERNDLRGYRSVEGRLREALDELVGPDNYENVQVSSRTDRGVHALKNTLHVDIRPRSRSREPWNAVKVWKGLNYYLSRQPRVSPFQSSDGSGYEQEAVGVMRLPQQDVRVLSAVKAPLKMRNHFYSAGGIETGDGVGNENGQDASDQTPKLEFPHEHLEYVDWNARFSATERTYVYRVIQVRGDSPYGIPFESDVSWRVFTKDGMEIRAMKDAASAFVGTHDFTSFRGAGCQRLSPVVTLNAVQVDVQPYGMDPMWTCQGGMLGLGRSSHSPLSEQSDDIRLITIRVNGQSFLYRQVRNIVGCLVEVGQGRIDPQSIPTLLENCDRSRAPAMAPAQGLFLVDVQHGDFVI